MKRIYYYSEEEIKNYDKGITEYEGEKIEEYCQDEGLFPILSEIIDTDYFQIPAIKVS